MSGGAYVLVLRLAEARRLPIGPGALALPAGSYAYAGDARTGLDKRVERHKERGKPVRSHVDALTEVADVVADARWPGREACDLATHLARGPEATPVVGVGTSGCACLTHLFLYPQRDPDAVAAWAREWPA